MYVYIYILFFWFWRYFLDLFNVMRCTFTSVNFREFVINKFATYMLSGANVVNFSHALRAAHTRVFSHWTTTTTTQRQLDGSDAGSDVGRGNRNRRRCCVLSLPPFCLNFFYILYCLGKKAKYCLILLWGISKNLYKIVNKIIIIKLF